MKKKLYFVLFVFLLSIKIVAQAPSEGINYQAVVYSDHEVYQPGKNLPQQLLSNVNISVRFSIIQNSANGTEVYKESHTTTTDAFGMFSLVIGQGTPQGTNTFPGINWGAGKHFLKVEIDKTGGTNFVVMSNQQLWSVPYALYSQHAATADSSATSANATTAEFATNSAHADSSDYADVAGNGITGVTDNGNGTLTFTYLDGSIYTTPVLTGLTGPQGPAGQNGANGQSAYDIWLAQGNTGTQQDFLNSLQGAQGTPGSQNAWSLTGNTGTTPTTNFIGTTDSQDWVVKTNNAERIRITSSGNLGIGTITPTEKIEILNGNINLTAPSFDANSLFGPGRVELYRGLSAFSPHTNGYIDFKDTVTDDYDFRIYYSNPSALAPSGGLVFRSGPDASFNNRMTILNNGNVGIGTANTLGKLHVNNDVSGSDSSFVVTTDGKVGVGTSSPISKFEVNKGHISTIVPYSASPIINTYDDLGNIKFRTQLNFTSTYSEIDFDAIGPSNTTEARFRFFRHVNTTGPKEIRFLRGNGTTEISGQIAVDGGNSFFQRHGGNFGIGTAAPARTLHVNAVMRLEPISTAPTSPAKGDMYFDSTINKLRVFDGTTWQSCW